MLISGGLLLVVMVTGGLLVVVVVVTGGLLTVVVLVSVGLLTVVVVEVTDVVVEQPGATAAAPAGATKTVPAATATAAEAINRARTDMLDILFAETAAVIADERRYGRKPIGPVSIARLGEDSRTSNGPWPPM